MKLPGFAFVIWIAVNILVLVVSIYQFDGTPNSDIEVFLTFAMLALNFPLSLLGFALLAAIGWVISQQSGTITVSLPLLFVSWTVYFLSGWVQWLFFFPKLLKRWRGVSHPTRNSPSDQL